MRFARELVPIHTPRPLRDPLRGGGLGCLRTRAMTPAHPCFPLRGGKDYRLRGGIGPGNSRAKRPSILPEAEVRMGEGRSEGAKAGPYRRIGDMRKV